MNYAKVVSALNVDAMGAQPEWDQHGLAVMNLAEAADAEIERLRKIEKAAIALIENIRENGVHDNWKTLANALRQ